jgi:hypothetical protein
MQRKQPRTAALIAGLVVCAMAALASSSWASTPHRYVLRHPKREHCKAHYARRVVTVRKRIHGRTRKVRETVCIHRGPKPALSTFSAQPMILGPIAAPVPISPPAPLPPPRGPRSREPGATAPTCTSTFTGAEGDSWGTTANWAGGVPGGFSSYGCIPPGYPYTVAFSATPETPTEIGGIAAENPEGVTLQGGHLTLANPEQQSLINNVKPGATAVTLDKNVVLQLTGTTGELGGNEWNGPGTLEIPRGAFLRTGECPRWTGQTGTRCIDGTPSSGHGGLQVKNFGTMYGAGISLCRNGAAQPAKLDNEYYIRNLDSGGFGGASECGEVGSVRNGPRGRIEIAELDGNGCNVQVTIASLLNEGFIKLGSCSRPETAEVRRPTLEIGSSLGEAGSIIDGGIVHIQGDYTPTGSSELTIGVKQTFPRPSPETNYGTVKVSGSAVLAGALNVETSGYLNFAPALGQTFQILDVGEVAGSLSGGFTLGSRCIPSEPGNGYKVIYKLGSKGTVTLEVAEVAGC